MSSTVEGRAYEEFQKLVHPVHVDRRDFNSILSEEAGGWDAGKLKRAYAGLLESYQSAGAAPADWGELAHLVGTYRPIAMYGMAMRWQKGLGGGGIQMRANARGKLTAAEEFFYKYAAGSHKIGATKTEIERGKREYAKRLAHAEAEMERRGWEAVWEEDPEGYDPGMWPETEVPAEVLTLMLKDENGNVLDSLDGIGQSGNLAEDRRMGRLYEAEMALEALK